jgi:hypothetical protein
MLGPIISGSVASRVSWRWFFWACTAAQCLNFIGLVLFFPETRWLGRNTSGSLNASRFDTGNEKKEVPVTELEAASTESESGSAFVTQDQYLGRGKPSRAQYSLFQKIDRTAVQNVARHFITPVQLFFFPIVLWASWSFGFAANALLGVNLLQSQAFAAPPYNFNPAQVGYANFGLVVGGIIGLAVAGPWSDWVCAKATQRNKGIREPEMRLIALVPFIIACLVGMVVSGRIIAVQKVVYSNSPLQGLGMWLAARMALAFRHCCWFRLHWSASHCYSNYCHHICHRFLCAGNGRDHGYSDGGQEHVWCKSATKIAWGLLTVRRFE